MIRWLRARRELLVTSDAARVRTVLTLDPSREWGVVELHRLLGLSPGRLYVALARLEYRTGEVRSRWVRSDQGPPRRRRYRIATSEGGGMP